ncbi:MOP flippase family protein [Microbacterium sp. NPDC006705]|uniref:MOP flippase family protein n=1 Tax=Microbacterium sp. NPDC006705 TaxID=3364181 RepID=UPI00384CC307
MANIGKSSRAISGGMWIGASIAIGAVIQLAQTSTLAHQLAPTALGAVASILVIIAFGDLVVSVGVSNAIVQRQNATEGELSSLFWLNVAVGAIIATLVGISGPILTWYFQIPGAEPLMWLVAVSILATSQAQVPRGVLEREMRFRAVALAETIGAVTLLAVTTASVQFSSDALFIVLAYVTSACIRSACFAFLARKTFKARLHFELRETRRFVSFGAYQVLDSIVTFAASYAGPLALGRAISPVALGGFTLATTYAVNTPARINGALTRVAFPAMSSMRGDRSRLHSATLRTIEFAGTANAPLLFGLAIVAEDFVAVVFGREWIWITPVLQILAMVGLTRALANPIGATLMATDRMRLGLIINLVKSLVTIALVITGSVSGGVVGAALGLLIAGILTLVINSFLLRHLLGMRLRTFLWAHVYGPLLVLPMAIATWGAMVLVEASLPLARLLVAVTVGMAVYAVTVFVVPNPIRSILQTMRGSD